MKKLSSWIQRISTGKLTLICLLGFILFTILVLPDQAAKAEIYSSGIGSPDTSLFYTADQLYEFASAYGAEGRAAYIRARFTFDVVWPLVYLAFLSTSISWVFKPTHWQQLNLLPLFGVLFDFLENISAALVMARYPQPTPLIPHLAGLFTFIKWVFVGGSFLALVAGLILFAWRRIKPAKEA